MKLFAVFWMNILMLFLISCSPGINTLATQQIDPTTQQAQQVSPTDPALTQSFITLTTTPAATEENTQTVTASPTQTTSIENTSTPLPPTNLPANSSALIIDHRSIAEFDLIPDEYIQAATEIKFLHRHASVGANILQGLACLMDDSGSRPFSCDRDVPPGEIVFNSKYDYTNWTFEFHSPPPNPNPGWWNKVNYFIERLDAQPADDPFVFAGFNLCYVDAISGSAVADVFFKPNPNDNLPGITDLESAEQRHPQTSFVYWTLCLAKIVGTEESTSFNTQMRDYALSNGKILMDLADIESHNPDGQPCLNESGYPVICPEYNNESKGGHLNARGQLRMAKAMWVLLARLAGWDGGQPGVP